MRKSQLAYLPLKRLIGIIGSIVGIIVCFVLLWWWVIPINAIVTKGHPFFIHRRLGRYKKPFKLIKFRSMKLDANPNLAPSNMSVAKQASMETKFGKFLRVTSIDETPQLFNILAGQMAFIGPRPGAEINEDELIRLREQYTPSAFEVRPGLSGYAQTRINRDHDPNKKAYLDHYYVTRISLWFDILIFGYTVLKLFGLVKGR